MAGNFLRRMPVVAKKSMAASAVSTMYVLCRSWE